MLLLLARGHVLRCLMTVLACYPLHQQLSILILGIAALDGAFNRMSWSSSNNIIQ